MVSTSVIAVSLAGMMVLGLIAGLASLGLFGGVVMRYWGRPKLTLLRSLKGKNGFAFALRAGTQEKIPYNLLKLKLFNPFGRPRLVELAHPFPKTDESFALDFDMGPAFEALSKAKGADKAVIRVELESANGQSYGEDFKASLFFDLVKTAQKDVEHFQKLWEQDGSGLGAKENFWTVGRDFIADTVPGKGAQLAVPTNPAFAAFFQGSAVGGAAGGEAAQTQENFSVTKVWIEDGCIVCNACEDIYPEVFKVIADGCEVRPEHPTDDGLKVEEAAEACPVEIIKFAKA
ncbi:MAG: ferredoxin [Bacteriovoracales bacterium]|nr:ferredoxin [Bacteriovoracales bacterium]